MSPRLSAESPTGHALDADYWGGIQYGLGVIRFASLGVATHRAPATDTLTGLAAGLLLCLPAALAGVLAARNPDQEWRSWAATALVGVLAAYIGALLTSRPLAPPRTQKPDQTASCGEGN
jgi:hypothetical protein